MKVKLIDHLKLINQKKNIWTAKELFGNNILFNAYVKQFRKIGINLITIPRNRGVSELVKTLLTNSRNMYYKLRNATFHYHVKFRKYRVR